MTYQILDAGSIWLKEFASALSRKETCVCWEPRIRTLGHFQNRETEEVYSDPPLKTRLFPLQRGYARFPIGIVMPFAPALSRRLLNQSPSPVETVLVCTTPFYAPVAEKWPGLVVYYQTDLTVCYAGVDSRQVRALDTRMCKIAALVCANSERVGQYLIDEAGCAAEKLTIIPNATRAANVAPSVPRGPGELPGDIAGLPRPIAGVIGNLAANMDWIFLRDVVSQSRDFSWIFVGPTTMPVYGHEQRLAREHLLSQGGRIRFIGTRSYGQLQAYARSLDVAFLPYLRREPTYSGSSTRFYEHLAACRPMIATRGFAELLSKEPLLKLVSSAKEAGSYLEYLRGINFRDGNEDRRWMASLDGTWEKRAETMRALTRGAKASLSSKTSVTA